MLLELCTVASVKVIVEVFPYLPRAKTHLCSRLHTTKTPVVIEKLTHTADHVALLILSTVPRCYFPYEIL